MTDTERQDLILDLESSRRALVDAVAGVTEEQAGETPATGWSVRGLVEHCALAERGMLAMVSRSQPEDNGGRPSREDEIRALGIDRARKLDAPPTVQPGRYETLAIALARFNEARDRTVAHVQSLGDDLRGRMVDHPVGRITARECLIMMIQHPRRHADQIREVLGRSAAKSS